MTALVLVLLVPVPGSGEETSEGDPLAAFRNGTVNMNLRYRFEAVWDEDARYTGGDGYASTLRTVLGYRTASYRGFTASIEFENVTDLGLGKEHNNLGGGSLGNGVTDRPAVADPEVTEVNQVHLQFDRIPGTVVDLGRREMVLADQRFVGPVGWRQNHQSFDGITVTQKSILRTTLVYGFIHNVNRIFGDNHPMASHVLDATVAVNDRVTVGPYVYYLDYERAANAGLSTATAGLRGTGSWAPAENWRLPFHAEAAWQGDAADNPGSYDVAYYRVGVGLERGTVAIGAGYEVLGGKSGEGAFSTPLATLHKFNGWADKFLNTPANGLRDLSLGVKVNKGGVSGAAVFHAYYADSGGETYGQEVDVEVSTRTSWKQTVAAKLASYFADSYSTDTTKLWLYTAYAF
jgi:hypothetical protein